MSNLKNSVNPLTWNIPITNTDGTPTNEFQRKWGQQATVNGSIPDLTTAAGVSARLDLIGKLPGMLLQRGATVWGGLASPADATKFLNGATFPAYAAVKDSDLALTDITANNASNLRHGFAPKSPADATKFLNGAATPAYAAVKDSDLSVSDVTTNNVSITAHGFAPKAPNDATKFLDGTGAYSTPPSGGTGGGAASIQDDGTNIYVAISDGDGQLVLDGAGDPVFMPEVFPAAAIPALPYDAAGAAATVQALRASSTVFGLAKVDNVTLQAVAGLMSSKFCGFYVTTNSTVSVTDNTRTPVVYPTVVLDTLGCYNASTGVFTPTKAGKWLFFGSMFGSVGTTMQLTQGRILNGAAVLQTISAGPLGPAGGVYAGFSGSAPLFVITTMNGTTDSANVDTLIQGTGGADSLYNDPSRNNFGGLYLGA